MDSALQMEKVGFESVIGREGTSSSAGSYGATDMLDGCYGFSFHDLNSYNSTKVLDDGRLAQVTGLLWSCLQIVSNVFL